VDSEGHVKEDEHGNPIKKANLDSNGRPIVKRDHKQKANDSEDSEYSVDSDGQVKVDKIGKPINKFERDPNTGKAIRDSNGDRIDRFGRPYKAGKRQTNPYRDPMVEESVMDSDAEHMVPPTPKK